MYLIDIFKFEMVLKTGINIIIIISFSSQNNIILFQK